MTAPALIQSTFGNPGNFDVMVGQALEEGTQGLRHYYWANSILGYPWFESVLVAGTGN